MLNPEIHLAIYMRIFNYLKENQKDSQERIVEMLVGEFEVSRHVARKHIKSLCFGFYDKKTDVVKKPVILLELAISEERKAVKTLELQEDWKVFDQYRAQILLKESIPNVVDII